MNTGVMVRHEEEVTDEQLQKSYEALGFVDMTPARVKALRDLGLNIRQAGILTNQRGVAMFNQTALIEAMDLVKKVFNYVAGKTVKPSHKARASNLPRIEALVKMIALLSDKLTDSQELMIKLEGGTPAIQSGALPDKLQKAFIPGSVVGKPQTVIVAQNVQMNAPPPEKALPKTADVPRSGHANSS